MVGLAVMRLSYRHPQCTSSNENRTAKRPALRVTMMMGQRILPRRRFSARGLLTAYLSC